MSSSISESFQCRTARTCLCCPSGTRARPTASRSSGTLGRTTASVAGTLPSLTSRRSTGTSMQPLLQHVSIKWNAAQTHARKPPSRARLGTVVHECSKGEIVRKWKCCHKKVLCMYDLAQCLSGFLMISGRVCTNSILYFLEPMYLLTHLKKNNSIPWEELRIFQGRPWNWFLFTFSIQFQASEKETLKGAIAKRICKNWIIYLDRNVIFVYELRKDGGERRIRVNILHWSPRESSGKLRKLRKNCKSSVKKEKREYWDWRNSSPIRERAPNPMFHLCCPLSTALHCNSSNALHSQCITVNHCPPAPSSGATPSVSSPSSRPMSSSSAQGSKTGKDNGYTMLFDIESFDYSYYNEGSEGLKLALVHHLDMPIMRQKG